MKILIKNLILSFLCSIIIIDGCIYLIKNKMTFSINNNINYVKNSFINNEINKNVLEENEYVNSVYTKNIGDVRMSKTKKIQLFHQEYNEGKIEFLDDKKRQKLCKNFEDTVIIGDSLAEQFKYMIFNDNYHVKAKRGVTLPKMGDMIEETINQYPKNIIFLKGLNDAGYYQDSHEYVFYYEQIIKHIKSKLPNVNIYICSLLPPTEKLLKENGSLAVWQNHNNECKIMCSKLDINYIDTIFLLKDDQFMRNDDGLHFTIRYYDMWLQYMDLVVNY